MPPLGGPGRRRVNTRAYAKRQRNLRALQRAEGKRQRQQSLAQERYYASLGGAVRRAAKTQAVLGPGVAVRPPRGQPVLKQAQFQKVARQRAAQRQRQQSRAQERYLVSQGAAIEREANRQAAEQAQRVRAKAPSGAGLGGPGLRQIALRQKTPAAQAKLYLPSASPQRQAQLATLIGAKGLGSALRTFQPRAGERQSALVAPALNVLEQVSRPVHATAGATRAAIRGENVL